MPAQVVVAASEEVAVAAVGLEQSGRVGPAQLQHARGHVLQEVSVVTDDEHGAHALGEDAFEPEDAFHVEVVGGLVHEQHVGRGGQRASDGQPLLPAARQRVDCRPRVGEAGTAQGERDAAGPLALAHLGQGEGDHLLDGDAGREDGVLRHVADTDVAAHGARAPIRRFQPRQDLEEGGFAGAIGTHQTDLVSLGEPERQILEERPRPVSLADRLAAQEKRPDHPALLFLLLRLLLFLPHARSLGHVITPFDA